jgi:aryl carrier-like protein
MENLTDQGLDGMSIMDLCEALKAKGAQMLAEQEAAKQEAAEWDVFWTRTGFGAGMKGGAL